MNSFNILCISLIIEYTTNNPTYIIYLREISKKWNNTIEFYSPNTWSNSLKNISKRHLVSHCIPIFKIIVQNNINFNFLNAIFNSCDDDFVFFTLDFIDKDYITTNSDVIEHICKKNLIKSCQKLISFGVSCFGDAFPIAIYAHHVLDSIYLTNNNFDDYFDYYYDYDNFKISIVRIDNSDYAIIKLLLNADCPVAKDLFFSIIINDRIDIYKLIIVKQYMSIDDRFNDFFDSYDHHATNIFLFLIDTYKFSAFTDSAVSDFIRRDWPQIIPHIKNNPIRNKIIFG